MDYFEFQHSAERTFSDKFIDLFGPPRVSEPEFYTYTTNPQPDLPGWDDAKATVNQHYADIAASIQVVTEETMLKLVQPCPRPHRQQEPVYGGRRGAELGSQWPHPARSARSRMSTSSQPRGIAAALWARRFMPIMSC